MPGPHSFDFTAYSDDELRRVVAEALSEQDRRYKRDLVERYAAHDDSGVGYIKDVVTAFEEFDPDHVDAVRDALKRKLPTCTKTIEKVWGLVFDIDEAAEALSKNKASQLLPSLARHRESALKLLDGLLSKLAKK